MASLAHINVPSLQFQNAIISAGLNGLCIGLFLSGVYFGVYVATIVIYIKKRSSHQRIILACLTVLFAMGVGQVCTQWYYMSIAFNQTRRLDMYAFLSNSFIPETDILGICLMVIGQVTADGLMIWRSIHASPGSLVVISLLTVLFVGEVSLGVAFIILQAILDLHPKHSTDYFNWVTKVVEGCYFCMTVATSILASLSIGWKIYTHSRHNQYSKAKYNSIIEIVVQSSSIYAFACLVEGIIAFSSTGNSHIVFYYISPISIFATVFSPTLMVARLATLNTSNTDSDLSQSNTLSNGLETFRADRGLSDISPSRTEGQTQGCDEIGSEGEV